MQHKFTFKSVSVTQAIRDAAECHLPTGDSAYGMTVADCEALARLQVNRFLSDSPEFTDANDNTYKFKLATGKGEGKRAEWSRTEKSAGGIRLDEADDNHKLGNRLGWFDQHMASIEKGVGNLVVSLPDSILKPLRIVWDAALKQRASRSTVNA